MNPRQMAASGNCDIVLTTKQEVYINGTKIGNVISLNVDQDMHQTAVTIELRPTSMVFGQVPNETVEALAMDQAPDVPTVDIQRAISRAQARAAGLNPDVHAPAPLPPSPAPVAAKPKKASYVAEAEPMDVDAEQAMCAAGMGGGDICIRPYGHSGAHRA